jgi:hypothetical protein
MTDSQAERWVTVSALVVAGIYGYRRLTEQPTTPPVTLKELAGVGELPPLGAWATAWGFTFLVVAIVATAAPELGAAFAILIATGDLMTNAQSIFSDVAGLEGKPAVDAKTTAATSASSLVDTPTGTAVGGWFTPTAPSSGSHPRTNPAVPLSGTNLLRGG